MGRFHKCSLLLTFWRGLKHGSLLIADHHRMYPPCYRIETIVKIELLDKVLWLCILIDFGCNEWISCFVYPSLVNTPTHIWVCHVFYCPSFTPRSPSCLLLSLPPFFSSSSITLSLFMQGFLGVGWFLFYFLHYFDPTIVSQYISGPWRHTHSSTAVASQAISRLLVTSSVLELTGVTTNSCGLVETLDCGCTYLHLIDIGLNAKSVS